MDELFGDMSWHGGLWLAAAGLLGLLGGGLAMSILPNGPARPAKVSIVTTPSIWRCSLLLALSGWVCSIASVTAIFPHPGAALPIPALLQGWAMQGVAAALAVLIAARGRRTIRNVALAGALLSGGGSCMVFTHMSGLAAPAPLGYDLRGILWAMALSGTLAATGFWQAGASPNAKRRLMATGLIAASLAVVSAGSLRSVLSFAPWGTATIAPHEVAPRPVAVVFISACTMIVVLGVIGAVIDRCAASLIDRENLAAARAGRQSVRGGGDPPRRQPSRGRRSMPA